MRIKKADAFEFFKYFPFAANSLRGFIAGIVYLFALCLSKKIFQVLKIKAFALHILDKASEYEGRYRKQPIRGMKNHPNRSPYLSTPVDLLQMSILWNSYAPRFLTALLNVPVNNIQKGARRKCITCSCGL